MLVWRTVSAGGWKSAQHPPGGLWDILLGRSPGVLLPAVRICQETLVFPEDVLRGTDSIKELSVLNFLVREREVKTEPEGQGRDRAGRAGGCVSPG